jgi:hypothetical protein
MWLNPETGRYIVAKDIYGIAVDRNRSSAAGQNAEAALKA